MSNAQFTWVACLLLAAHLLAPALVLARWRGGEPVLALNLAVAAGILVFLAQRPGLFEAPVDEAMLALGGFAILSAVAAMAAWRRRPFAMAFCWLALAVQMLASLAAVIFALTFRMTRLF